MTWLLIVFADRKRVREWAREEYPTRKQAAARAREWRQLGYSVDLYRPAKPLTVKGPASPRVKRPSPTLADPLTATGDHRPR